jgi:hypothetical protein
MATKCLQAACSLISILPESPNLPWLARSAPWYSVLHFLMQATTALLLGLWACSLSIPVQDNVANGFTRPAARTSIVPGTLETDLSTAIAQTRKALFWIHAMASVDPASKRAFNLCASIVRKIAPPLGLDLKSWPDECVVDNDAESEAKEAGVDMM